MSIYYDPEKFGLEKVHELDLGESYTFDLYVVWRRKSDGALLWGYDSGCSCPSPFEDQGVDSLEPAKIETIRARITANSYGGFPDDATVFLMELAERGVPS